MDIFYSIDLAIFYFFNHTISTGFFDKFFSMVTNVNNWYITYIILLGLLFFKGGRVGKISVLGILILITITDQTSHKILKEFSDDTPEATEPAIIVVIKPEFDNLGSV